MSSYGISDMEAQRNREEAVRLSSLGYKLTANCNGYDVWFRGVFLAGASVLLPRQKPLRGRQGQINCRENLDHAVRVALRHEALSRPKRKRKPCPKSA